MCECVFFYSLSVLDFDHYSLAKCVWSKLLSLLNLTLVMFSNAFKDNVMGKNKLSF